MLRPQPLPQNAKPRGRTVSGVCFNLDYLDYLDLRRFCSTQRAVSTAQRQNAEQGGGRAVARLGDNTGCLRGGRGRGGHSGPCRGRRGGGGSRCGVVGRCCCRRSRGGYGRGGCGCCGGCCGGCCCGGRCGSRFRWLRRRSRRIYTMCRFQRRAQGKIGDGIVFGGCWLPTIFFASVIVIPVVNDLAWSIVQNAPLCAGFQFNDVEAVAFCIGCCKGRRRPLQRGCYKLW